MKVQLSIGSKSVTRTRRSGGYAPSVSTVEQPVLDGRRARRERGRLAVIDAMVDLIQEGHTPPTAEAIAERSGVSVASVFRYFDSLDDLQQEATTRFFERYAAAFEVPGIGAGTLGQRADRYARARLRLYETITPVARLTRARSIDHPTLAQNLHRMRRLLAEQARAHFAPELSRCTRAAADDVVGSISTLTSFESWDTLRHDLDRSPSQIRRAWVAAITALLPPS